MNESLEFAASVNTISVRNVAVMSVARCSGVVNDVKMGIISQSPLQPHM